MLDSSFVGFRLRVISCWLYATSWILRHFPGKGVGEPCKERCERNLEGRLYSDVQMQGNEGLGAAVKFTPGRSKNSTALTLSCVPHQIPPQQNLINFDATLVI